MKRLFSFSVASTITFILSILAILVIAVSAPGMVQAVLGPAAAPASPAGSTIQESPYYGPVVNPAANFGSLTDNGTAAYMGIGMNAPVSPLHIYSTTSTQPETIDLDGAQPITAQWNDYSNSGGSFSGSGFLARFARGSRASPVNVTNGDRLGFNVFGGWVGGAFRHTAAIEAMVDEGTVSVSSLPTYMRFSTTPDGSMARQERMRITGIGRVGINTTTPDSTSMLHVVTNDPTDQSKAIYGQATAPGNTYGVVGQHNDGVNNNSGYLGGSSNGVGGSGTVAGVYGTSAGQHGVWGYATNSTGGNYGVYGQHASGSIGGLADNWTGVYGSGVSSGVTGVSDAGYGVDGHSTSNAGVYGISTSGYGVQGTSTSNMGVQGHSTSSAGVAGYSSTGNGIFGQNTGGGGGYAGYFSGNVYVSDNLTVAGKVTKGSGSFKIDHPQDPENKYLEHSFVESPDMMNVYNGNILLDAKGEAVVAMPSYFESLNRDFRYQLTAMGTPGPNLYIAEEIVGNHFKISGGKAGMKVSWMVTGIRKDVFANAHPVVVEEEKAANEKGLYLHPTEWGQPEEKAISKVLNK